MSAGKEGKTTVFLITDTQIKDEKFLEDVDGLLNAGEVPNLFAIDEKQDIIEVRESEKEFKYHLPHHYLYTPGYEAISTG